MTNSSIPSHASVVIIGGGQAGLAMSYHLKQSGIDHVILEKHQIAHSWKDMTVTWSKLLSSKWPAADSSLASCPIAREQAKPYFSRTRSLAMFSAVRLRCRNSGTL